MPVKKSPRRSPYLKDLLTTPDAADYIAVSRSTLERYRRQGLIEPTHLGGRVYFTTAELDCFLVAGGRLR